MAVQDARKGHNRAMSRRRNRRPAQQHAQDTLPGTDRAGATDNHTGQSAPMGSAMNRVEHAQETDHGPVADAPGSSVTPAAPGPQTGAQAAQDEEPGQDHGQVWSASEAARRCNIPRTSLTRMLVRGQIPGAEKDAENHWRVPLAGLLAAGLTPTAPASEPEPEDQEPERSTLAEELAAAREQIATLRVQLAEAEGRVRAAEQVAEERAARIEDLRLPIFRSLTEGQPAQQGTMQATAPAQDDQETAAGTEGVAGRFRKWWRGQ